MHRLTLKFLSSALEKKYQHEAKTEVLSRFLSFVLLELFFSLFFLIYTFIISTDKLFEGLKFMVIVFLMILLLFLKKYSFSYLTSLLKVIFLGFVVLFTELIKSMQETEILHENAIALVIPLQLILSMLILTKTNWIICSFYYFFSLIYFFLRLIVVQPNENPHFSFVIIGMFLSFCSFSFMSYNQEKMEKNYYKNINDSCENLNYFKLLLQNLIPSPIFIVDYNESIIRFTNNSAIKLFTTHSVTHFDQDLFENEGFSYFQSLLSRFSILQEKNDQNIFNETKENQGEALSSIIRKYYQNKEIQPLAANSLNFNDLDVNFLTINVSLISCFLEENDEQINYIDQLKNKRFYELKIVKISWENRICLLVVLNDNTNIFRISELINLDLYKNQLLASVSHDLRTPLNGLNGMLEMAIPKIIDKEVQSHLIIASKSANLLNFLINDILDFSQMNFKKLRLNIEEIDIKGIISEMRNLIEFQAREKNVKFIIDCKLQNRRKMYSDANRLKQILLNLLSNSLKFTHEGSINLMIEDLTEKDSNPTYLFIVQDTGVGIKKEDISKLFQLFGRLENSKNINKTGIGLGLTISKMLSKLLSPKFSDGLQVESIFGVGSKFYFYLTSLYNKPTEDFEKNHIEERISVIFPKEKTYEFFDENCNLYTKTLNSYEEIHNKKILVVDDDLINIMIAEQYLQFFKIKSIRALNGLEAFKIVKNDILGKYYEISMIIMDCNMPIMDGFQASEKIAELIKNEKTNEIPILAVTANLTVANKELCKKSGIKYYLEKPVRRDELKSVIEGILKIKL